MHKNKVIIIISLMIIFNTCYCGLSASEINIFETDARLNDILFVGGNGLGNYTSIQSAIENASNGDTIYVYNGIYELSEKINIIKKINLIGEQKNTTILTSEPNQNQELIINADEISVLGFSLQNIIINNLNANHISIINNTFKIDVYNQYNAGVINSQGSYNIFKGNTIILYNQTENNRPYTGINLGETPSHSIISSNTITGTKTGLFIGGENNTISGNTFIENKLGLWLDFRLSSSTVNQITDNNFIDNQNHADFFITLDEPFFSLLRILISYHGIPSQNWNHNYWEDHNNRTPKIIPGNLNINPLEILGFDTQVQYTFQIPWRETDLNPVSNPL
jgi:trimeric autotransporter adhesin